MESAVSTHPIARLLVVAIPGLLLALVLGYLLGEGNTTLGVLVLVCAIGVVVVGALSRAGQLEAAIVGFLIFGYFVGNRGFAQLAPIQPVFVGEMGMLAVVTLVGIRGMIARDLPKLTAPVLFLVALLIAAGTFRFAFDFRQYKIDAIRDFAVIYYAVFCFVGYQLGKREATRAALGKWLIAAVALHVVIAVIFMLRSDWLARYFVIRGAPLFIQKGDLTATFSAVGICVLALHRRVFGMKWLRIALLLVLIVCLALGIARAATLGALVAAVLLWIAGQRRFFAYAAVGALLAVLMMLLVVASGSSLNKLGTVVSFKEKVASTFDFSGTYKYRTDLGVMKADNNEFRRTFWKIMIDDTTAKNPLLGMGFGYNFLPRFESYYNRGTWEGLRSPHNIFVTIYGRMGLIGLLLFALLAGTVLKEAVRAAGKVRRGEMARQDLGYWCGAVVLLVSGTFGVVLEGPMGGIPFWTFLGLALSSPSKPRAETAPAPRPTPAYAKRFVRAPREGAIALAQQRGLPGGVR